MISDVLFEAIEEIERYQNDLPQCYDEIREEINAVKETMRALQIKLDTPPST
jgi:peptidoglycan hydrolase CwlO-like protein